MSKIILTTNIELFIRRCGNWTGTPSFTDMLLNGVMLSLIIDGHDATLLDNLALDLSVSSGEVEGWLQRRDLPERKMQHRAVLSIRKELDSAYRERLLRDPTALRNVMSSSLSNEAKKLN